VVRTVINVVNEALARPCARGMANSVFGVRRVLPVDHERKERLKTVMPERWALGRGGMEVLTVLNRQHG